MFIINILDYFIGVRPIMALFSAFGCFGVCLCVKKVVMRK